MRFRAALSILICSIVVSAPGAAEDSPALLPAVIQDVSIPAEGLTLAGTLYLPEREGSVPGLVLVHGSGPQERRTLLSGQLNMQFGFTIPVFEGIALALQEAGIAVLIYDKRTCSPWNGCAQNDYPAPANTVSVLDFASDAASALRFIGSNDAVDSSRRYVAGHSQGGQLVPEIITRVPELAGALVVAGNYSSIEQLLKYQSEFTRKILSDVGMETGQINSTVAPIEEMATEVSSIKAGTHDGSPIAGASASFWKSWIDISSATRAQVRLSTVPIHVIGGGYDWNVPPVEIQQWQELFESLPDRRGRATTKLLPCVTHALNCVDQPDWQSIRPADIGKSVDRRVIGEFVAFIETTSPAGQKSTPSQSVRSNKALQSDAE